MSIGPTVTYCLIPRLVDLMILLIITNKIHITENYSRVKFSYMKITRYLKRYIQDDLKEKMVFLGGPRQVGKTTLSKTFIDKPEQYLNWDDLNDRDLIKKHQIDPDLKIVILDEVHKYSRWRTLVKGLYDKLENRLSIMVKGSAKLDLLRKGGDSLVGRYHYYRLHPLTLNELDFSNSTENLVLPLKLGGFPEPFYKKVKPSIAAGKKNESAEWYIKTYAI